MCICNIKWIHWFFSIDDDIFCLQGPDHCNECRTNFLQTQINGSPVRLCLETCPVGTYLNQTTSECVPCYEHCDREIGCVGPLPYLDLNNGCLNCSLVQLNHAGGQVMCSGLSFTVNRKRGRPLIIGPMG